MQVKVRRLGLAAYVKIKGGKFLGHYDGMFHFESDKDEEQWEIEYVNTEAYAHDLELMNLRNLMKRYH